MPQTLRYTIFQTKMGWMGVLASEKGLLRITLPQKSEQDARLQLGEDANQAKSGEFEDLANRFKLYFSGKKVNFPDRLDFSGATIFQWEVWEMTRLIPYGETRSYLWVAEQLGKTGAVRAVGQALGRNPLPIIVPCHRVIASDGRLGGFGGGLEMKRRLLRMEAKGT